MYNTLSSISRLAKFGQVDKQHQMVMNLAKFYRLSLNDGQTIIAIHKELEQTQAYLDIQQVKYGERMEVEFDIEPRIVNYMTVKLILQPFLENALQHAWRGDHIYIRVSGRMEEETDSIVFEIMDDGSGMPQGDAEAGRLRDERTRCDGKPRKGKRIRNPQCKRTDQAVFRQRLRRTAAQHPGHRHDRPYSHSAGAHGLPGEGNAGFEMDGIREAPALAENISAGGGFLAWRKARLTRAA
ncbi:histidine kinase [Paenibacillus sp. JTLBN-2024]